MTTTTISSHADHAIRHELLLAFDRACADGATGAEIADIADALEILAERVAYGSAGILARAAACRAAVASLVEVAS